MNIGTIANRDREFLPAALEILETPPSPTRRALLITMTAFCLIAFAWSFYGRLDIHAVAQGKIIPQERVKVIEPLESGKISAIYVANGSRVSVGDALIEFDPLDARADETASAQSVAAELAEIARRGAALEALGSGEGGGLGNPPIVWDDAVPAALRQRQQNALQADLRQLADGLHSLDLQIAEKRATLKRLEMSVTADARLVGTLQERVDMRQELIRREAGTKANLIDAVQDLQRAQTTEAFDRGQLAEFEAAINTLKSQKAKSRSDFAAENTSKLNDAANKAEVDIHSLSKARAKSGRTLLRAPVDGVVQKLSATTIGQVMTTGQSLMTIVPANGMLHIEAFISNADIGFVKKGQEVAIKVDSFPYTRYGTLKGKVLSIATDAIDETEARMMQANTTSLANSANSTALGSTQQAQVFVFPVTITMDQKTIAVGDLDIPLSTGMSVTVEIKTDNQRIIDYLLMPIARTISSSLHER